MKKFFFIVFIPISAIFTIFLPKKEQEPAKNQPKEEKVIAAGIVPNHHCTGSADPRTGIAYCTECGKEIHPGEGIVAL